MEDLTRRQRKALRSIRRFIEANGYPPSVRELAHEMGGTSSSEGTYYLHVLARKGYLERTKGRARAIRLVKETRK